MITPTRGYVLIEPDKAEEKSAGGVYIAESAQEKPQKGTVISVGKLSLDLLELGSIDEPEMAKGDKVYFKRWGGDEIKEGGKEYKLVKFEDVLAVIS